MARTRDDVREVRRFSLKVYPKPASLTHHELADELERIASLLRQGYYSGDLHVAVDRGVRGYWDTFTTDY